jgi:hypothetical protein
MLFPDDPPSTPPSTSKTSLPSDGKATDWKKFFSGKTPVDAQTVRTLVIDLSQAGKHEDVIALIEQAIVHGQIQPWMYEVLALTMEAVGRPRAQIERVLLSSRDLTADDSDSILYLAAYLTRFERYEQALRLYRQVSVLDPLRVESYVMGLGVAEKLRDPAAVAWAAPGVLLRAWGKDRAELHRRAEDLARQTADELRSACRELEAAALDSLMVSAKQRDLHMTLEWNGEGDLDLEIIDPTGEVCGALQTATAGGVLHVQSGQGPRQEDCREEAVAPAALPGEYRIVVKHVAGDIVGKRARLTIVRYEGTPREVRQTQTIPLSPQGQTVRVLLKAGRLPAPLDMPMPPYTATARGSSRRGVSLRGLPTVSPRVPGRLANGAVVSNVGFQPIVQFVPSGVQLSTLALVSADRRYVRISTSPMFTNITDVFTFSFTGATGPGVGSGAF